MSAQRERARKRARGGPEPGQNHPTPPNIEANNPSVSRRLTEGPRVTPTIRSPMLYPTELQARPISLVCYAFSPSVIFRAALNLR